MRLSQHKLCTTKTELAFGMKFLVDFHRVTCRRPLTKGSDVNNVFPRCPGEATHGQTPGNLRHSKAKFGRHQKWQPSQVDNADTTENVFDVTSVGQRSSPWTCNSVKVGIKFHLECKLHFPSAQLMLRQMHLTKVFESIEAKYCVSWLSFDV